MKKYVLQVDVYNHKLVADLWTSKDCVTKDEFIRAYDLPYKKNIKFSNNRIKVKYYLNELILLILKTENIRLKDLKVQIELNVFK
jgi:hypothetical protein